MQCYTELTPPTAVTHAINIPFLSSRAHNLVVAKSSLLQIFELRTTVTEADPDLKDETETASPTIATEAAELTLQRTEHTSKLVLVGEYGLSGTATSLARVKILHTKSGGEALLLAFRDAKLSLVEWDPERYTISTISIHYYEGEELQESPLGPDLSQYCNYLSADPSSRCAALKFGARHLAILPFVQPGDDDDPEWALDAPPAKGPANGDGQANQTPYFKSFVLPLTLLDPSLTHPVHLAFLHEYREPTFGIISSTLAPSSSLLQERKDILTYSVFTLDISRREKTGILSIPGLPSDISEIVPLPLPIGGALLVGTNQLVHVDQAGKTNAVAVNEFARQCSSFPMADQSDLGLTLESCVIEQLSPDNGDLLMVLRTGQLAIIGFKLDGRSVAGLSVHKVLSDHGGLCIPAAASCSASLGRGRMFIGSEDCDSCLLGWTRKTAQLTRKRSHVEMLADDHELSFDEEDLDDDDDDLYTTESTAAKQVVSTQVASSNPSDYQFRIHDTLLNLAPLKDCVLGRPMSGSGRGLVNATPSEARTALELVASTGRTKAGGIAVLKREVETRVLRQSRFPTARFVWSVHAQKPPPKGLISQAKHDSEAKLAADADHDRFLVVSRSSANGSEESAVYNITADGFEETTEGEFEREEAATVDVGTLAGGTRIVQILKGDIRIYDSDLRLAQILPMEDEATESELKVISASFADPYLLVLRDDSSVIILEAADSGEIEELEHGEGLLTSKWLSACLYKSAITENKTLAFLLDADGSLQIFEVPDLSKPVYQSTSFCYLPPTLSTLYTARRAMAKAAPAEILVADLGDRTARSPYLIVRTSLDEIILYQPFHYPHRDSSQPFSSNLDWAKVPQAHLPRYVEEPPPEDDQGSANLLRAFDNICGYSTVFVAGSSPSFILKEASGAPRILSLKGKAINSLSTFNTSECDRGFVSITRNGDLEVCQLIPEFRYDLGWAVRKINLGQEVQALSYYPPKNVYVLSTNEKVDFKLPEDDYHQHWSREDTTFLPKTDHGMIRLYDPPTGSIIDTFDLEPNEIALCVKTLNLEVSEETHERKQLIAIGTALVRGEDLGCRGHIYIFEVIIVVPEPGRPETNRKLKLIVKEEVKGAVTALTEIGSQGFLLMAQGQKCLVRGLKEDGTLLPVAFMDMQCYVTVLKQLRGTNMILMGDALKGIWFTGLTEEPYRMLMFGKGGAKMEVTAADFLPDGQQLYVVAADADCDLHILQFDPEHPKSLAGQRLLQKSTFHAGHFATTMTLLPSSLSLSASATDNKGDAMDVDVESPGPSYHVFMTMQSGCLALVTPIDEQMYRRLGALQNYLVNLLDHPCGLNPRAYRAVESEGFGSRGMLDGGMLKKWLDLSSQRRAELCAKVGAEDWVIKSDLEFVGGGGLAYL